MTKKIAPKEFAWEMYRAAWDQKTTMDDLTGLEERTARNHFEELWKNKYE